VAAVRDKVRSELFDRYAVTPRNDAEEVACEELTRDGVAWAVFAVDYFGRLTIAPAKWAFIKTNLLDLAVVALPLLRPLRLIRLLALLSILNRAGTRNLRGRVVA